MRTKNLIITGILFLLSSLPLVGCDDDDSNNNNQDVCEGVDCGNGTCVDVGDQASCDCDAGYHADGLTCVEDATANTAPVFTSTPPTDATEMVVTGYALSCSDADGDDLHFFVDTADTCDGTLVYSDDGTGGYTFLVTDAATTPSCVLAISCSDGTLIATQTQTITIHAEAAPACVDDGSWLSQLDGSTDASSLHGGTVATAPWDSTYDAGLDDLVAVMPTTGSSLTVDIPITGATIIASYFANGSFRMYIADANAFFKVFLSSDASQIPPFTPKTGSRISFTVTEITNYDGTYEVTEVAGDTWTLDGTGFAVPVTQISDATPVTAAHVNQVVRVSGTVVSNPAGCGTDTHCFDLDYGAGSTVVFRTSTANAFTLGTCVTFQGPVTLYNGQPQLTTYGDMWWNAWQP